MKKRPTILVLAGVNGAGKSSIGGEFAQTDGNFFFNPDQVAARIRSLHPDISHGLANAHAWQIGKSLLEEAIRTGRDYRFETTLGGRTIPSLLDGASAAGHQLHVWFCGLSSPELHLARVRRRAGRGGHDIPEEKIRERWRSSRENLVRLLPLIHHLRVYDNSREADPAVGECPQPVLLLEMRECRITAPDDLSGAPEWAQAILAAAIRLHAGPE